MYISAVFSLLRVIVIAVVIEHADLISAVQHRYALQGEHKSVKHHICCQASFDAVFISLVESGFYSAQRRRSSAEPRVPQDFGIIVEFSAGRTSRPSACEPVVEVFLVRRFLHTEPPEVTVIKAPAYIIMASEIVLEQTVVRKHLKLLELVAQEFDVSCSEGVPYRAHRRYIIEHIAFRLFRRAEIRNDFLWLHHDFSQEENTRTYDPAGEIHHAHQNVDLRKIAAVGAKRLPDVRNSIQSHNIHAPVSQIQKVVGHVIEDHRVGIVEIPLEWIERGHHDLAAVVKICIIARSCFREYFRQILFVLVRNVPGIIEEVPVHRALVAFSRCFCPLMFLAGMVHDKIQAHHDTSAVAVACQFLKVIHCAQIRSHLAEI